MQYFLNYLLQVSLWFIPLYLLYLAVYKRFTFFAWNRIYLLGIMVAAFVLPFVHYDIIQQEVIFRPLQPSNTGLNLPITDEITDINPIAKATATTSNAINWGVIMSAIYIVGVLFALTRLFIGLISIKRLIKQSRKNWTDNLSLVYTNDRMPHSSFFHYIFLNNKTKNRNDREKIIYHEMQHNEKLHTIDVLFCEVLKIVLWFNPFIYWYKNSLQEIHEFEVDAEMTKLYNEVTYAELLLKVATENTNELTNSFSTKPLKTRLKMIFNHKTLPMKKLAFLLVIPVVTILLFAFRNIQYKTITTVKGVQNPLTIMIDAGHGGTDAGAIEGDIKEKDINLAIANMLKQKAEAAGYKVIMARTEDVLIDLKARTALTTTQQVDLLISIHVNSAKEAEKNGIEYYVGKNNNPAFAKQSMLAGIKIMESLQSINNIMTISEPKSREAGIWILKASNCPSVLVELGYLSNENDRSFITNNENQSLLADKLLDGITKYLVSKTTKSVSSTKKIDPATSVNKNYPDTLVWKGKTATIKESTKKKPQPKDIKEAKTAISEIPKTNTSPLWNNTPEWLLPIKKKGC